MKKPYALLVAGLLCTSGAMAQSGGFERCSAMEVLHNQIQNDPQMEARMNAIEAHTQKYLKTHGANQKTNAVVTIPVVVHVVWNTAAENISDAQIQSQINVLNADFRKLNSDVTNTPSAFAG